MFTELLAQAHLCWQQAQYPSLLLGAGREEETDSKET